MKELSVFGVAILLIFVGNWITFLLMREHYKPKSKITVHKNMPLAKTTIYVVGGRGGMTHKIADCLTEESLDNIVLVECGLLGWDPTKTAEQIVSDIVAHAYPDVKIYTVGIGCQVVGALFRQMPWMRGRVLAVDPCLNESALKEPLQIMLLLMRHLLSIVTYGIGILSYIPIPCFTGKTTSLALLLDQMNQLHDCKTFSMRGVESVVYQLKNRSMNLDVIQKQFNCRTYVGIGDDSISELGVADAYMHAMNVFRTL